MNFYNATQILSFLLVLCFSKVSFAQELIYSKGVIEVAADESSTFTQLQTKKLSYGNIIRTGDDSLAVISFPEGSKLKVDPNSQVEIGKRDSDQIETESAWSLKLLKGALTIDFEKKNENEKLYVEGDHFAVGVRGTRFLVAKESDDDWHVAVNEGKVTAFNKENYDYEDINSGQGVVLEKGKELTKPAAFEWSKDLDWNISRKARASQFFNKKLRNKRRAEVRSRLKKLRQRKRRELKGKMRTALKKRIRNRMKRQKSNMKKRVKQRLQNQKKKTTPQQFRQRMRKKKIMRRRRN